MTGRAGHHHAGVLLAVILLWAGCAGPQLPSPPQPPPTSPPALEAQSRLLHTARAHLSEGSYEVAGEVLRRLIETNPDTPVLLEAHSLLARSYEQAGNFHSALAQYRLLATLAKHDPYGTEAQGRITELEKLLGPIAIQSAPFTAILLSLSDLPAAPDLDPWVQTLGQAGFTVVVAEGGRAMLRDGLSQLVPIAHRHGLSVFAAITPRRMTAGDLQFDWTDRSYDPAQRQLRSSPYADLFHPGFQDYLVGFLVNLAGTGLDGVLFRADAPLGPTEGFSASALQGFEGDFQLRLDPDQLFPPPPRAAPAMQPQGGPEQQANYALEFWRWAGWKARESLKVLDRLRAAMRQQSPGLRFALELHPEAVTNPASALVQYGEDLLEAKRSRFDFYLTGQRPGFSEPMPGISQRMIDLIGDAERIWIAAPLPVGELARLAERVHPATDRDAFPKGVSLLYMGNAAPIP